MATITPQTIPTAYDQTLDAITFTALSAAEDDTFTCTGREILIFRNDDVGAVVVTITSTVDPQGRTGDTTLSMAASTYATSQMFPRVGWAAASGLVSIVCADADMFVAILRLP